MKKSIIFVSLILLLFLSTNFVLAEENKSLNITGKAGEIVGSLDERTEDVLQKEVDLPSWLEIPTKVLFGIPETIKLQYLVILLGIWVMLFMVIIDSLHLIFEKTWMRVAATIAILILLSITGTVAKSAIFLLDFWNVFELFQDLSFLGVLASIALIVIVILIFPWIRRKIKKEQILTKAKIVGQEAGAGLRMVRADYKRKKKVLEG